MMKRVVLGLSAVVIAAPLAMAQPDANKDKAAAKPAAAATRTKGVAHIRVLHGISGAAAADIYLDGKKVADNISFGALTNYLPFDSGKAAIKITAAGKTDAVLEGSQTLARDGYYTIAAYGTTDKAELTTQNDLVGKVNPERAQIRAFNLASGLPEVEITTPSTRAKDGAANLFKSLAYGKDMMKSVIPGKITVQVRAEGKVIKEVPNITLEGGKKYAIFTVGKAGGEGAQNLDVIVKPVGQ